jgi:hypothetical protein
MKVLNRYFYNNSKLYLLLFLTIIEVVAFLSNANYFDILVYPVLLYIAVSYLANNDSNYYILDENGFLPFTKKTFIKRYNLQCVLFAVFGFIGNSLRLINGSYDSDQILVIIVFNIVLSLLFIIYTTTIIKKTKYHIIKDLSKYILFLSYLILYSFEELLINKLEITHFVFVPSIIYLIILALYGIYNKNYTDNSSIKGLSGLISMKIIKKNSSILNDIFSILFVLSIMIIQSEGFDFVDILLYSSLVITLSIFIDQFKSTYRDSNYLKIVPVKKKDKLLNILTSSLVPYLSIMFLVIISTFINHKDKLINFNFSITILLMLFTTIFISFSFSMYLYYNKNNDTQMFLTIPFVSCLIIAFVFFNAYFNYLLYISTIISIVIVMKYIKYYI